MSNYLLLIEPYVFIIYIFHALISLILAVVLSRYTVERYKKKSEEIAIKDKKRLKAIVNRGFIYKKLFNVSLHKNNRISNIVFIFLFNFAMPLLGYFFSVWITWYLKNVTYEKKVSNTNILNLDEFGILFLKVERIFGEGSMVELMNSEYAPRSKKLKALSSLSHTLSPANLKIIRSTLSSTDDEIRMFGYATINKAEKSLSIKINNYLEIYKEEEEEKVIDKDLEKKADAAKELAMLYWEMVYTELSHESLKSGFLVEIKKYVRVAKDYYVPRSRAIQKDLESIQKRLKKAKAYEHENPQEKLAKNRTSEYYGHMLKEVKDKLLKYNDVESKLYILMGKVYMNEKNYEYAVTEFTIAQELYDGSSSFILPYLAEIQFLTGNYTIVSSIMNQAEALSLNATLHPIVEQWRIS